MKNKKKRYLYIPLALSILAIATVLILRDSTLISVKKTAQTKNKVHKKENKREIASIKKAFTPKKESDKSLLAAAHLPKNWKSKYKDNFLRMHVNDSISNLKVTYKKSIQRQDGKTKKTLEHILVKFNKPNGDPMSFEALLDSKTGTVKQTWNQTKYERKKRVTLNGSNRLMVTR